MFDDGRCCFGFEFTFANANPGGAVKLVCSCSGPFVMVGLDVRRLLWKLVWSSLERFDS